MRSATYESLTPHVRCPPMDPQNEYIDFIDLAAKPGLFILGNLILKGANDWVSTTECFQTTANARGYMERPAGFGRVASCNMLGSIERVVSSSCCPFLEQIQGHRV